MAYYNNQDDEEQNTQGMNSPENQQPANQTGGNVQLSGGLSGSSSTPISTGNQGQAARTAPKATSSGMSGFQNYQKANLGTATDKLSGAASGNVAAQGQAAKTGINQATQSFGKKVESGTLANRQNALQDVKGAVEAARGITAPVQPQQAQTPGQSNNILAGIDPTKVSRFQEVINAKYQGPESLRQSGDYQKASGQVGAAQTAIDQSQTAQGREELLRNMFSKGGAYTQGLNKLDAGLLNASQAGVTNLQQTAKEQGNLGQQLDQAQIASANLAANRAQEIRNIKQQSREAFTEGKKAEEAATESRLSTVIKDWEKLPEYFRDIIRNKDKVNQDILNRTIGQFKQDKNYDQVNKAYSDLVARNKAVYDEMRNLESFAPMVSGSQYIETARGKLEAANIAKRLNDLKAEYAAINPKIHAAQAAKQQLDTQLTDLTNKFNQNAVVLNPFEAAVLGVNTGEGLYKLGTDAVKTAAYDKERLISRDEQSRQAALSALGALDAEKLLSTNLLYGNAEKAGTQSALDALDVEGIRERLNAAEQDFRSGARGTNITGYGEKKVSRGNAWGKKTRTYGATVAGNVADMLRQAGYDVNAALSPDSPINSQQLLRDYLAATNTQRVNSADGTLQGAATGAATGAGLGALGGAPGASVGGVAGAQVGAYLGGGTTDQYQQAIDVLGEYAPGVAQALQDARTKAGEAAGALTKYTPVTGIADALGKSLGLGSLSSGIQGAIGGIDTGAMKSYGEAIAKDVAIQDLQRQYKDYLASRGFDNRFAVAEDRAVTNRMNALQQLLNSLDKTNT